MPGHAWPFPRLVAPRARGARERPAVLALLAPCAAPRRQHTLSIDRRGLLGQRPSPPPSPAAAAAATGGAPPVPVAEDTPLLRVVRALVSARGPVSVAEFTRLALGHPTLGYYMRGDVFGPRGDFTTSPEVSHVFSELVAVWLFATWRDALGAPRRVRLVELGPGRGTLAADVLRVVRRAFPSLAAAVTALHLVETSPGLRLVQARALGCDGGGGSDGIGDGPGAAAPPRVVDFPCAQTMAGPGAPMPGLAVLWHDRLEDVDRGDGGGGRPRPPAATSGSGDGGDGGAGVAELLIAHELFDALPVHQFVRVACGGRRAAGETAAAAAAPPAPPPPPPLPDAGGLGAAATMWRERLVDVDESGGGLRLVLAPGPTPASTAYASLLDARVREAAALAAAAANAAAAAAADTAAAATAAMAAAPATGAPATVAAADGTKVTTGAHTHATSRREANDGDVGGRSPLAGVGDAVRAALDAQPAAALAAAQLPSLAPGAIVEYSPAACRLAADIALRVARPGGGAALIVDYGHDAAGGSAATGRPSVRGIRRHAFAPSFTDAPGLVDISADVDFAGLRAAARDAVAAATAAGGGASVGAVGGAGPAGVTAAAPTPPRVAVLGPVTQSFFLQRMGIGARAERLLRAAAASGAGGDVLARLAADITRLAHPDEMGGVYKVMAIVGAPAGVAGAAAAGSAVPPGFE